MSTCAFRALVRGFARFDLVNRHSSPMRRELGADVTSALRTPREIGILPKSTRLEDGAARIQPRRLDSRA